MFFSPLAYYRRTVKKGVVILRRRRRLKTWQRYVIAFMTLVVAVALFFTAQFRPLMLDSACNAAKIAANDAINQTVCDMLEESSLCYEDLIVLTRSESGEVTSLEANAARINRVKSQTALRVREVMKKEGVQSIGIPLGTLCASTLLSGRGPKIRCRSLLTAIPTVSLQYHFDGAGINQTLHSIIMNVSVPLSITLPLQSRDVEVHASFLIGETILVGVVPDNYTNVISDPEVADDIFNYGDP